MNSFQSIIIAIIEGITEFLPISSTAHMKFANPVLGVTNAPFVELYEVVIQLAAIASILVVYRKQFFNFKEWDFYVKLMVAVLPALVFGALLKKHIDAALSNLTAIACVMLVGGIVLLFIDRLFEKTATNQAQEPSFKNSFIIGCFQVLSILFPGLSRSAATIIGGMTQKLSKKAAAEFSFFLAVPTMLAASAKSTLDVYKADPTVFNSSNLATLVIGGVVAFIVALITVKYFIQIVQKSGFAIFGWYRIVLGALILGLIYFQYL